MSYHSDILFYIHVNTEILSHFIRLSTFGIKSDSSRNHYSTESFFNVKFKNNRLWQN
jgi:hypothetical protein